VPAERLHLTLHFIGAVPVARLAEVGDGLAVPCAPFDLQFDEAAAWPRGLAVLSPREVPAALVELHQRLAGALQRLALPVESRPWRPHVTLARRAAGAVPPAAAPAGRWAVRGYALVQSQGGYRTLRHYPASSER
jgi:2'-5' RNA ligase